MISKLMKIANLAAIGLIGASLAAPPAAAVPVHGGSPDQFNLVQVAKKNSKKPYKKHNYSSGRGYIPGYVPTPYGPGDCIGWWEPLGNGLMRCHGQFLPYRY
jgi:hypothetical protein